MIIWILFPYVIEGDADTKKTSNLSALTKQWASHCNNLIVSTHDVRPMSA